MATHPNPIFFPPSPERLDATVEALVHSLAATAIERDRLGGTPVEERRRLRESGLLAISLPRDLGGWGLPVSAVLDVARRIARIDPSIAHVFAFHHLMLETVRLFGGSVVYGRAARDTVAGRLFWGNALNPKDTRTTLGRGPEGRTLEGRKSFCSGALDSDRLVVSAIDAETHRLVVAVVPTGRTGIRIHEDWDAFGQRQTDSGTVEFEGVEVKPDELLVTPGPLGSTAATLRPCYAQAIFVHLFVGIAEGALAEVRSATRLAVDRRAEPRELLERRRAGELRVEVEAASALAARAASLLDAAFRRGDSLTPDERGEVAVAIAVAKVAATRASLSAASGLFDLRGARATSRALGLDRYWRNARTHTLHDPVEVKLVEIGTHTVDGEWPVPSFYS